MLMLTGAGGVPDSQEAILCGGASEAGCMYSRTEKPHLSLFESEGNPIVVGCTVDPLKNCAMSWFFCNDVM